MRVLITGAGMVAAHTSRSLIELGHSVTLFSATPRHDYVRRVVGGDVPFIEGDVRELPAVAAAVKAVEPDVVIHTAARIGLAAQANPYAGFQVNVEGSVHVAEAVRLHGVRRLLHTSTLGVHDLSQPQPSPLSERFPIGGGDRIYGAAKVACEQLLWAYSLAYGFELGLLRLAGVYGFGYFTGGSGIGREILDLVKAARDDRVGRLGAGMPDRYEIVHVKDAAQGITRAAIAPTLPHHIYNVGSGVLVTREDVVAAMRRSVPTFRYDPGAAARQDRHPRMQPMDLSRSKAELGYEPTIGLESGLADLLAEVADDRPVGDDRGHVE
jgi:nucleoside-diphosphate-sugar epimerase